MSIQKITTNDNYYKQSHIHIIENIFNKGESPHGVQPSRLELWNIPTATSQSGKIPPRSIQDMTLNNLMVWLQ